MTDNERRFEVLSYIVRTATEGFLMATDIPEMSEVKLMGNTLSKLVLTTLAMQGAMKDPQSNTIYRSSAAPLAKFFGIGELWMQKLFTTEELHEVFGKAIDDQLRTLYQKLADYFVKS